MDRRKFLRGSAGVVAASTIGTIARSMERSGPRDVQWTQDEIDSFGNVEPLTFNEIKSKYQASYAP